MHEFYLECHPHGLHLVEDWRKVQPSERAQHGRPELLHDLWPVSQQWNMLDPHFPALDGPLLSRVGKETVLPMCLLFI